MTRLPEDDYQDGDCITVTVRSRERSFDVDFDAEQSAAIVAAARRANQGVEEFLHARLHRWLRSE